MAAGPRLRRAPVIEAVRRDGADSATKVRKHPPPSRFAAYMARSACLSRSSTVVCDAPAAHVNPMLGRTVNAIPSMTIGELNASRIRSAADTASSRGPSIRTANSSPPSRATRCASPTYRVRRPATRISNSSPAGWPKTSLTVLKSSRSRHTTASGTISRRCRSTACSSRSRNSARLASPVRPSRKACRATSDNSRWFSTSTTNCRASTARTRTTSHNGKRTQTMSGITCPSPKPPASSNGRYGSDIGRGTVPEAVRARPMIRRSSTARPEPTMRTRPTGTDPSGCRCDSRPRPAK